MGDSSPGSVGGRGYIHKAFLLSHRVTATITRPCKDWPREAAMEGWLYEPRSPVTSVGLEGGSTLFPWQHTDGRQPEPQQFLSESVNL